MNKENKPQLDDSDENWYEPTPLDLTINPLRIIGDEDASIEWMENEKLSVKTFFHTDSYEQFQRNDLLYLYGRRGSGKTSIIQMMHRRINADGYANKHYSVLLNQDEAFIEMLGCINKSLDPQDSKDRPEEVNKYFKYKWRWVINVLCMKEVLNRSEELTISKDDKEAIKIYLASVGIADVEVSPIEVALNYVKASVQNTGINKIINIDCLIDQFNKATNKASRTHAENALDNILLSNSTQLTVLIDSLEYIYLNNACAVKAVEALVEVTYDIYLTYKSNGSEGILEKVAFPSEIQSKISSFNAGKTEGKTLRVIWTYKDLASLLAKRFYMATQNNENVDPAYLDSLNTYEAAIKHLNPYFPDQVKNIKGFMFDTLGYIIRHTHKKPRHIIMLVNAILTYAIVREKYPKIPDGKISKDSIIKGVHCRLDLLFDEALNIYDKLHNINTKELVRTILYSSHTRMTGSTLDEKIKKAHSIRSAADMSAGQVKRLLIESGVIGHEVSETVLPGPGARPKMLVSTDYEYQINITPEIDEESTCAIHPLMYQSLNCKADKTRMTYPVSKEDEEMKAMQKTISSFE